MVKEIAKMLFSSDKILKRNKKDIFPFYHTVSDQPLPHVRNLYNIRDTVTFEKDLDTFCKYFEPVSLGFFLENKTSLRKPAFHLTFDDGLRECYEIIRPILLRKGIPATFFLNNDFIDNMGMFYRFTASLILENEEELERVLVKIGIEVRDPRAFILSAKHADRIKLEKIASEMGIRVEDYLAYHRPYMTSSQISEMIRNGFTIGSHSHDHISFSSLNADDAIAVIKSGTKDLERRFGVPCHAFSFPFTNHDQPASLFGFLREDVPSVHFFFGTSGVKDDIDGVFQRIPMEKYNSDALSVIAGQIKAYRWKKILGRYIVKRS